MSRLSVTDGLSTVIRFLDGEGYWWRSGIECTLYRWLVYEFLFYDVFDCILAAFTNGICIKS